jgi:iron(III) transport system substrate-binding protein
MDVRRYFNAGAIVTAITLVACAPAAAPGRPPAAPADAPRAETRALTTEEVATLPAGADRQRILEEGARREGQLMMYTSSTGLEAVAEAFMKKYPYVRMEIFVSRGEPLAQRTQAEARAGRLGGDVLRIDYGVWSDLKDLMIPFNSPGARFDRIPNAVVLDYTGIGFTYSKARVSPTEVPQKVEDLLLPRWRQSLGLFSPPNNYPGRWVSALLEHLGDLGARDYLRRLGDQRPYFYTQPEAAKNGLMAGEWDFAMQGITNGVTTARKGEPIGWAALDPTLLSPTVLGLTGMAPHPHAAMLFLDWALSPEGLRTFTDVQGSITQEELDRREKEGVKLPARITIQSPADHERLTEWMKLFDELVVRK